MSKLSAFLNPGKTESIKVVVSKRFKDESGKPVEWELVPRTTKEAQMLSKSCEKRDRKGNISIDNISYQNKLICSCIVFPDLKSAELQEAFNVIGEEELLTTMLYPGEYAGLREKIYELCGLDDDINDDIEEAKN